MLYTFKKSPYIKYFCYYFVERIFSFNFARRIIIQKEQSLSQDFCLEILKIISYSKNRKKLQKMEVVAKFLIIKNLLFDKFKKCSI